MSQTTLVASIGLTVLTSLLYLYIGRALNQRKVSADAKLAQTMFVLWWQALGWLGLLGAGVLAVYMTGHLTIWFYQAYLTFVLLVLFAALWGLQFYLVYLYTGSRRAFTVLGVFYGIMFLATLALVAYNGTPERIVDTGWALKTEPVVDRGLAFGLVFSILLIGPQIVAAVAYARLYGKTSDPTQKYRIAMVTGAIIVWFGSGIVATAAQVNTSLWWQLASRMIGIAGALVILMAYKPPAWIQRRGIRSISDEATSPAPPREV